MTHTAYFDRFSFDMPAQCIQDCSHQGSCDEDIEFWFQKHEFNWPTDDQIKMELREYGTWSDEELCDADQNKRRLIWIAAGNIKDELREESTQ